MLRKLSDWVKYRTVKRYHMVNTGMTPGYADVTERMLQVNFNMLKDFVEIEKAYMYKWCELPDTMEQPGVSYLFWEMALEDEIDNRQAKNAREIYEIYDWWTNQRPYRVEDNTADWDAYQEYYKEVYGDTLPFLLNEDKDDKTLKKLRNAWLNNSTNIENKNLKEDDEMLIRLMRVRNALWT